MSSEKLLLSGFQVRSRILYHPLYTVLLVPMSPPLLKYPYGLGLRAPAPSAHCRLGLPRLAKLSGVGLSVNLVTLVL